MVFKPVGKDAKERLKVKMKSLLIMMVLIMIFLWQQFTFSESQVRPGNELMS